jgi:hypothetical protein
VGNTKQPVAHLGPAANGLGLADQNEESGLKRVLGIRLVAKDAAAYSENHPTMAPHQRLKGGFITAGNVALEQITVRKASNRLPERGPAQVRHHAVHGFDCHSSRPPDACLSTSYFSRRGIFIRFLALPDKFELDEYRIMERFCATVGDEVLRADLLDTIGGRGTFGRWKNMLHRHKLLDQWYRFRDQAVREFASAWLEANQIPYQD